MQIHMNSGWKKKIQIVEMKKSYLLRAGAIFLIAALITLFLTACDSGGGSDSGGATLNEGVFVDSPVSGLNYQTETQAGITDENGIFHYRDGENVRFSIGDVVLGEASARALMTPLHLVDEPVDEVSVTHPVVTNIARFLQSLDADANPENGIKIREDIIQEVSGRMIDFHQTVHEFETDTHVTMLFDTLNGLNMPHNGENWHLRATDQVRQHMTEHMDDWMNGHMGSGGYNDDHMGPGGGYNQDESSGSDGMTDGYGMEDGMYHYDDDSGMQDSGGIMNSGDNSTGDDWDDMHGSTGGGHGMGH